jgi:tetrahydromethanopterin S-methyltransferase subunit H
VDVITCRVPKGVLNDSSLIVVTVGAIPQGAGSRVKIGTEVQALYPAPSGSGAPATLSKTDCTSNGSIERRLADAIRAE